MDAYDFWKNVDLVRKDKAPLRDVCRRQGLVYQRIADQRSECRFPKLEDAYLLASAYGVSLEFLLTGERDDFFSPRILAIARACEVAMEEDIELVERVLRIEKKAGVAIS